MLPIKLTILLILSNSNSINFLTVKILIIISILSIKYKANIVYVLNKIFSSLILINYIRTQFSLPL